MAKRNVSKKQHDAGITITTPSRYGSHSCMVVKDNEDGTVICKDDSHEYVTFSHRIDNGLADPKRYA